MTGILNYGFSLHAEGEHGLHAALTEWLADTLGSVGEFIDEVVLHAVLDTAKIILFLFATYLLLELIEHRASDKIARLMNGAGRLGPLVGGALGAIPQCGFSTVAANFYTGRVITVGTLIAVFLSTSDEMLPILIAGEVNIGSVLLIMVYKTLVGIAVGFAVDAVLRLTGRKQKDGRIEDMCTEGCHCEKGILRSAIHHTVSVSVYILIVTLLINTAVYLVGEDALGEIIPHIPVVSHLIAALVGLIPNCSVSVVLTRFAMSGFISEGTMISGLLSGAGVGVLVLFRMNKHLRENIAILAVLVASGVLFGFIADLIPFISLI